MQASCLEPGDHDGHDARHTQHTGRRNAPGELFDGRLKDGVPRQQMQVTVQPAGGGEASPDLEGAAPEEGEVVRDTGTEAIGGAAERERAGIVASAQVGEEGVVGYGGVGEVPAFDSGGGEGGDEGFADAETGGESN